jgi:hypothetical protein
MQDRLHSLQLEIRVVPMQLDGLHSSLDGLHSMHLHSLHSLHSSLQPSLHSLHSLHYHPPVSVGLPTLILKSAWLPTLFVELDYIMTCENKSRYNAPHLHICT